MTNPDAIRSALQPSLDYYRTFPTREISETAQHIVTQRLYVIEAARRLLLTLHGLNEYLGEVGGNLALADMALESATNNAMAAVTSDNMSSAATDVYNHSQKFREVMGNGIAAVQVIDQQTVDLQPILQNLASVLGIDIQTDANDGPALRLRDAMEPLADAQIDAVVSTEFYIHNL